MTNHFTLFPLDILSPRTLAICIAEYKRMLLLLGRFSDASQIQKIRALVKHALAELVQEAEKRLLLPKAAPKEQPAMVPVPHPAFRGSDRSR